MIWYICLGVVVLFYSALVWFVLKVKKANGN